MTTPPQTQLIVLFGAGASFGAGATVPHAPPLGGQLYSELARYDPKGWGDLPEAVRHEFGQGFEAGMQAIWDTYSQGIAGLMRHMTLYLAQFAPDGSKTDLYSRFVEQLASRGVTSNVLFSTLNYECVLELSASGLGLRVHYWQDDLESGAIRVWKLHGSCNFLSKNIQATRGALFSRGVGFEGGLQAVTPNDAVAYCLTNQGLYPAMALYMASKPVQIGQAVIHSLQKQWGDYARAAKRLLVVGVRPYPDDGHIWEPIAECAGAVGYVGPKGDFGSWESTCRTGPSTWLGARWNECVDESVAFLAG